MSDFNSDLSILMEKTFPEDILFRLKPVYPDYAEPCKICGGYISQVSRNKARKRNRRK